jgi:hypothetical protein
MANKYSYMKIDVSNRRNSLNNSVDYDIIFIVACNSINDLPHNMRKVTNCFLLSKNSGFVIFNLVYIYQSYLNVRRIVSSIFGLNNLITYRSNDFF